ncbi:putative transducin family protein [Monocercomonoides exilis]|uniref:putative transducin family protein n=1 Tax=Monocercomonoides exilis TaxID=2049356 RepID=UPI00355A0B8B|nr:putative transducin family protein [Monocercomonoides exilis]|eukprot:MONOS_608.1-p1 / transcript=MONOS_608.1 / gene=MONOS_608 / organism=Monocercomonoides_exilis_PA203 / gene_product=transducin family protein / transcript_product=transducin family protein / location=Mono_scaffold00009:254654-259287(+) / protein_length=1329 / sequence_SO=supercontig / SO=protein_coding / is_pseudo=false
MLSTPAHSAGRCDIARFKPKDDEPYSIATVGSDGEMRLYNLRNLKEPQTLPYSCTDAINAIAVAPLNQWAVIATQENALVQFALPNFEFKKILYYTKASPRHLSFSQSGTFLSCCGEEENVLVVNTATGTAQEMAGATGPFLSTAYDPSGDYISATSSKGECSIWDIGARAKVKTLRCCEQFDENSSFQILRHSFSPDGTVLAMPGEHTVQFYDRRNWQKAGYLDEDSFESPTTLVHWLPHKYHIVVASSSKFSLWDIRNMKESVGRERNSSDGSNIYGLTYAPEVQGIAFVTDSGLLNVCQDFASDDLFAEKKAEKGSSSSTSGTSISVLDTTQFLGSDPLKPVLPGEAVSSLTSEKDGSDLNGEEGKADEKRKHKLLKQMASFGDDDEDVKFEGKKDNSIFDDMNIFKDGDESEEGSESESDDNNDEGNERSKKKVRNGATKKKAGADEEDGDVSIEDNDDEGDLNEAFADKTGDLIEDEEDEKKSKVKPKSGWSSVVGGMQQAGSFGSKMNSDMSGDGLEVIGSTQFIPYSDIYSIQQPFQPGSTEAAFDSSKRLLACTPRGHIMTTKISEFDSTVEIEFTDSAIPNMRMLDHYNFTLAAMGSSGAAFFSPLSLTQQKKGKDKASENVLYFKAFQKWADKSDWTLNCPDFVIGLAVGDSYVAALTNTGLIRVFTPTGQQKLCFSVPVSVVCIAGGYRRFAVCYHSAPPISMKKEAGSSSSDESGSSSSVLTPSLTYEIYSPSSAFGAPQKSGSVPISAGSHLTWLGFTDGGALVSCDSSGIVRILVEAWGDLWIPICDLTMSVQSRAESLWIYGCRESEVLCIACPRSIGYPPLTEKVLPSRSIPFSLNFLDTQSTTARLEEEAARGELKLALMSQHREQAFVEAVGVNRIEGKWWRTDPLHASVGGGINKGMDKASVGVGADIVKSRAPTLKQIRNEEASLDTNYVKMAGLSLASQKPARAYEISSSIYNRIALEGVRTLAFRSKTKPMQDRIDLLMKTRFPDQKYDNLRQLGCNRMGSSDPQTVLMMAGGGSGISAAGDKQQASIAESLIESDALGGLKKEDILLETDQLRKIIVEQAKQIEQNKKAYDTLRNDFLAMKTQVNTFISKTKTLKQPTLDGSSSSVQPKQHASSSATPSSEEDPLPSIINPFNKSSSAVTSPRKRTRTTKPKQQSTLLTKGNSKKESEIATSPGGLLSSSASAPEFEEELDQGNMTDEPQATETHKETDAPSSLQLSGDPPASSTVDINEHQPSDESLDLDKETLLSSSSSSSLDSSSSLFAPSESEAKEVPETNLFDAPEVKQEKDVQQQPPKPVRPRNPFAKK